MVLFAESNLPIGVEFAQDGSAIVAGSHDSSVYVWSVAENEIVQRIPTQTGKLTTSPDLQPCLPLIA